MPRLILLAVLRLACSKDVLVVRTQTAPLESIHHLESQIAESI